MDWPFPTIQSSTKTGAAVPVWDAPTRVFHWLLAVCAGVAAATGFLEPLSWFSLHIIAGTTIAALIVFRLVWGVFGSGESRFSSFAKGPRAIWRHLQHLKQGTADREAGHNPLGAAMVFSLLAVFTALAATGAMVLGGALKQGPLKSLLSFATAMQAREVHELLAFGLLGLVVLHIAGVVFESRRTRENLARSMITGTKHGGFAHGPDGRASMPIAAASVLLLAGLASAAAVVWLSARPATGVYAMIANESWSRECSACHIAFHPSLLPAASWAKIMGGLDDHFGEDASLPAAAVSEVSAFLAANAAESWDTLPANRLRLVDGKRPMEVTATPFWLRTHQDIAEATFKMKPVGAKNNCAACHADAATGLFAPQNIAIPLEKTE